MEKCPYYHVHTMTFKSQEKRSDRQSAGDSIAHAPWCSHKHSPAEKYIVTNVMGGASILQCDGVIEKCQVPKDKFNDV